MTTRCKFRVTSVEYHEGGNRSIKFTTVWGDSPENKAFFASTPSGAITVSVVKPEVAAQFEPGAEFFVDFTEAEVAK